MKNQLEKFLKEYSDIPTRRDGIFTVYTLQDSAGDGSGTMKTATLLDGIHISYNDLDMDSCYNERFPDFPYMGINHCKEGTYEVTLPNEKICFMQSGDISINSVKDATVYGSRLPTHRYQGLTLMFEAEEAKESLRQAAPYLDIDLDLFISRIVGDNGAVLMHATPDTENIFSNMYQVRSEIFRPYLITKTIELLLYLNASFTEAGTEFLQFSPTVVSRTREACLYITENLERKITSKQLSEKFRLAETSLRECFKAMYGMPIATYIRTRRIKAAEEILKDDPACPIGTLAQQLGYENQSKFASAFRQVTGISPLEYRNSAILN